MPDKPIDLTKYEGCQWKRKTFGDGDIFIEYLNTADGKPLISVHWHFSADEEEMPMLYVDQEFERVLPALLSEVKTLRAENERLQKRIDRMTKPNPDGKEVTCFG